MVALGGGVLFLMSEVPLQYKAYTRNTVDVCGGVGPVPEERPIYRFRAKREPLEGVSRL